LRTSLTIQAAIILVLTAVSETRSADVFLRFKVIRPVAEHYRVGVRGHRHQGPVWYIPEKTYDAVGGAWSEWIDLRDWPLHGRLNRVGGLAEWPSLRIAVHAVEKSKPETRNSKLETGNSPGCALDVQLADGASEDKVVIRFTESSESDTICFLIPTP